MGRMSLETRAKVVRFKNRGIGIHQISKHLENEGVCVSKVALYALCRKYEATRSKAKIETTVAERGPVQIYR